MKVIAKIGDEVVCFQVCTLSLGKRFIRCCAAWDSSSPAQQEIRRRFATVAMDAYSETDKSRDRVTESVKERVTPVKGSVPLNEIESLLAETYPDQVAKILGLDPDS